MLALLGEEWSLRREGRRGRGRVRGEGGGAWGGAGGVLEFVGSEDADVFFPDDHGEAGHEFLPEPFDEEFGAFGIDDGLDEDVSGFGDIADALALGTCAFCGDDGEAEAAAVGEDEFEGRSGEGLGGDADHFHGVERDAHEWKRRWHHLEMAR